jgi:hypothetical protein
MNIGAKIDREKTGRRNIVTKTEIKNRGKRELK